MAADEEKAPEQELSESLMDFSNIGKTVDGSGYAYLNLDCVNKRINPIRCIEGYTCLQNINLSQNAIKDVTPLKALTYLVKLDLSSNEIANIKSLFPEEGGLVHLQLLDLSGNLLNALPALPLPALKTASFAKNEIANCQDFTGHELLASLDLSQNKIPSMAGIANMPMLTSLNVAGNELSELTGLEGVPLLEDFNLAGNKFEGPLEGPWQELPLLKSVDLSSNQIFGAKFLEVLRVLPKLRSVGVDGNPFCTESEASPGTNPRAEVLVSHWRLEYIDGQAVTDEEREQARELNVKMLMEERERKKKEEEDAAAEEGG
mmetsp:Transcript_49243/g.86677  ORF Transcript_49243/g.86677 Transcript_49243/m.86677 type:complete len:318 (-) Transcript_49243:22-975(-)